MKESFKKLREDNTRDHKQLLKDLNIDENFTKEEEYFNPLHKKELDAKKVSKVSMLGDDVEAHIF